MRVEVYQRGLVIDSQPPRLIATWHGAIAKGGAIGLGLGICVSNWLLWALSPRRIRLGLDVNAIPQFVYEHNDKQGE